MNYNGVSKFITLVEELQHCTHVTKTAWLAGCSLSLDIYIHLALSIIIYIQPNCYVITSAFSRHHLKKKKKGPSPLAQSAEAWWNHQNVAYDVMQKMVLNWWTAEKLVHMSKEFWPSAQAASSGKVEQKSLQSQQCEQWVSKVLAIKCNITFLKNLHCSIAL